MQRGGGDRRGFLRDLVGEWVERLVEEAEQRMAPRRQIRPPGALPEVAFLAACTRCGACVEACPPHAIRLLGPEAGLAAGTPFLEPARQPCTVCPDMPCAVSCPTDALTVPAAGWTGERLGKLELLPERCITFAGTPCGVCANACPVGEAALGMDDRGHPVLRIEGCVGCGVCVQVCVTSPSSFVLKPLEG